MEIYKDGHYWKIKVSQGRVPASLTGIFTSQRFAELALTQYREGIRSNTINVSERFREINRRRLASKEAKNGAS